MALSTKFQTLKGWGNTPQCDANCYRPEKLDDVSQAVNQKNGHIVTYGQGRSYGDAALCDDEALLSSRLDKLISFDCKKGIISAQSGVTLAEILTITLPKGWIVPVIPGTKQVSLGGAVASNIHGKNHFKHGDFAQHIVEFTLLTATGESMVCSATNNSDLFWATCGGMGLTGVITHVTLQLKKISSLSLKAQSRKVDSIEMMVEELKNAANDHEYMIGWIDHFAKGKSLGRGVVELADHLSADEGGTSLESYAPPSKGITIPKWFPKSLLNRYSMAVYNLWRFYRYSTKWRSEVVDFDGFFHPLDNLQHWNRLYGTRGFYQYQCLLPDHDQCAADLRELLEKIHQSGQFSFLAVLKYHGPHKGLLSFPVQGFSVALDFPNTPKVQALQKELNRWVAQKGGRIYLAKDALLEQETFETMYKDTLSKWKEITHRIDPNHRFNSLLGKRLGLKGERS